MSTQEERKAQLLKELQNYNNDESSAKPLFQSMKEISTWLEEKKK